MKTAPALKDLKSLALDKNPVTIWVVRRKGSRSPYKYEVLHVEAEDRLRSRLRGLVIEKIGKCNQIGEYDHFGVDHEDTAMVLDLEEFGFDQVRSQVDNGSDVDTAKSDKDLIGAWAYVIKIHCDPDPVYAFRKISTLWSSKKTGLPNLVFKGDRLELLDENQVFKIDNRVDFIGFRSHAYILSRSEFESAMNFRAGMIAKRDSIITELGKMSCFSGVDILLEHVGENMRYLRRAAVAEKRGYYRDKVFMDVLLGMDGSLGKVKVVDGKIEVTPENAEELLILLCDDRMQSLIRKRLFDVNSAKELEITS